MRGVVRRRYGNVLESYRATGAITFLILSSSKMDHGTATTSVAAYQWSEAQFHKRTAIILRSSADVLNLNGNILQFFIISLY